MWFALLTALDLFRTRKIRFLLTVSGVVVGVGSLVVMASLLEVGKDVLRSTSAEATGDDIVTVQTDWQVVRDNPDAKGLVTGDYRHLADSMLLPTDRTVTAEYGPDTKKATISGKDFTPLTMGVSAEAFEVHKLAVDRGRLFTADEYRDLRRVIVVGP